MEVSPQSMQKAQALLNSVADEHDNQSASHNNNLSHSAAAPTPSTTTTFGGFQTGRGKKMEVSARSLQKAQALLSSVGEGDNQGHSDSSNFVPPAGPTSTPSFGGFQTGRGKKMEVSAQSLQKAQALLSSVGEDSDDVDNVSSNSNEAVPPVPSGSFGGFQTGRGKKMEVSAQSLQKAQALLNSVGEEETAAATTVTSTTTATTPTAGFGGFQTGKGKKMEVSPQSLQRAHALLASVDDEEEVNNNRSNTSSRSNNSTVSSMGGFQSGRGKKMEVSAQSLQKAQALLASVEDEEGVSNGVTNGRESRSPEPSVSASVLSPSSMFCFPFFCYRFSLKFSCLIFFCS